MSLGVLVPVTIALIGVLHGLARFWTGRIERREMDRVEKVHQIRGVLSALTMLGLVALPMLVIFGGQDSIGWLGPEGGGFMSFWGSYLLLAIVGAVAVYTGGFPAYRRVRELKTSVGASTARMVRGLALGMVPPLVWFGFLTFAPERFKEDSTVRLAMFALFILVMGIATPYLIRASQKTRPVEPGLRDRLLAFAQSHGLQVGKIWILEARSEQFANAVIAGLLPWRRTIFITDTLIDELDEQALRAVLAHEIAHGKQHHLAIQAALGIALMAAFYGTFTLLSGVALDSSSIYVVMFAGLPIFFVITTFLVRAGVGRRLERRADDYASDAVGPDAMIRALEKMTEINMMKRRTGRLMSLFQHHPDVDARIDRLRRRAGGLTGEGVPA